MVHRQPNSCRHRMYRLHLLVEQTADITVSWPITDENDLCCNSRPGTLEISRASTWSLNTRNAVLNFSPCACHITSHWIGFVKRWAGSPWDSLGQVQSSGLWFKVLGHRMKNVLFWLWMHVMRWCTHPESPEGSTKRVYNTYTICCWFVEFLMLKWSVLPRVRLL